ncbi:DUF3800 domain-containing protein [Kingella negevensis]|nr:DUF3800 domain-containing protein [Kingella negevensis]MDK4700477.1 DUF3800 domain-containing protein [Kingella negevensis]MDK4709151.1 DUF3800 domain-containing protein [Kingella negevensis]
MTNRPQEKAIQLLAREFKNDGHSYGKLRNFAEVPLFLDSQSSRLIQLADLVSHAIYRPFAHDDAVLYDIIKDCFDAHNGYTHGLFVRHKISDNSNDKETPC